MRIIAQRKSAYVATGLSVKPRDWNEGKQEVRRSHPLAKTINAKLADLKAKALTLASTGTYGSAKEIAEAMRGRGGHSLQDYGRAHVERLRENGQHYEAQKYATTLRKAEAVFGAGATFDTISRRDLEAFQHHLATVVGNSSGTVRKELQRLRRFFTLAVRDDLTTADPFRALELPKAAKPNRRRLRADEIDALARVDLSGDPPAQLARDAWMFALYGAGVRMGDVCCMKVGDVVRAEGETYRLRYQMNKTGAQMDVPIPPPGVAIWARYAEGQAEDDFLFPYLRRGDDADPVRLRKRISARNVVVNRMVRRAAEAAGIEPKGLTFHVARHSYADLARTRSDNLFAISKTLGHSSLAVTQMYLRDLDRDAVDKLANDVWG